MDISLHSILSQEKYNAQSMHTCAVHIEEKSFHPDISMYIMPPILNEHHPQYYLKNLGGGVLLWLILILAYLEPSCISYLEFVVIAL